MVVGPNDALAMFSDLLGMAADRHAELSRRMNHSYAAYFDYSPRRT
jgi:hypothetical protein